VSHVGFSEITGWKSERGGLVSEIVPFTETRAALQSISYKLFRIQWRGAGTKVNAKLPVVYPWAAIAAISAASFDRSFIKILPR